MSYKLYDANGAEITNEDLQNKGPWWQRGVEKENIFVHTFGRMLHVAINPDKEFDPKVPDLIRVESGQLADLKTQNTPFFSASRYGKNPQTVVTFNLKDVDYYQRCSPNIFIYFWVEWIAVTFQKGNQRITVAPMTGIWGIPFPGLLDLTRTAPVHAYIQRRNDQQRNARDSYVLDLSDTGFIRLV